MSHDQLILLIYEVRRLQKKYDTTHSGLVLKEKKKMEEILDNVLKKEMTPRDPQQLLFEAS